MQRDWLWFWRFGAEGSETLDVGVWVVGEICHKQAEPSVLCKTLSGVDVDVARNGKAKCMQHPQANGISALDCEGDCLCLLHVKVCSAAPSSADECWKASRRLVSKYFMAQPGNSNSRDHAVVATRSVLQPSCEHHRRRSTLATLANRAARHAVSTIAEIHCFGLVSPSFNAAGIFVMRLLDCSGGHLEPGRPV